MGETPRKLLLDRIGPAPGDDDDGFFHDDPPAAQIYRVGCCRRWSTGGLVAADEPATAGQLPTSEQRPRRACSDRTRATVSPMHDALGATVTPAAVRMSIFSWADSPTPDTIAPAWPILRPLGA